MKIIGQSPKIQEVLRTADLVAGTDVPVLISGDTGTGKDLFARRIHQQSARKGRVFIKVNCASLVDESGNARIDKIFGVEGAIKKARSGSLLLDNISALPKSMQAMLLHFIETSEVIRADASIKRYNVRLLATTQHDLSEMIVKGDFRADLFYRLNVIPLELPALIERQADVSLLVDYFFRQFVREQHRREPELTSAALKQIRRYSWPGNVRELKNVCERLFILMSGKTVDVGNLPHELRYASKPSLNPFQLPEAGIDLEQLEADLIQQALQTSFGNKSQAARLLGLTRDTFLYRLKKYAIDA